MPSEIMLAAHELRAVGKCPVNGAVDSYVIKIVVNKVILVETLTEIVSKAVAEPILQEALTSRIARDTKAVEVTTICMHGAVKSVVTVRPPKGGWPKGKQHSADTKAAMSAGVKRAQAALRNMTRKQREHYAALRRAKFPIEEAVIAARTFR